jgi:polyhydroxyalkanoate synthase
LSWKLYEAFSSAYAIYLSTLSHTSPNSITNLRQLEKIVRHKMHEMFDERFRHDDFVDALSDSVVLYSDFAKKTGFGQVYEALSNVISVWNNTIVEPLRDTYWRTLSHKVCTIEKYSLFRYLQIADRSTSLPKITADKNSGSPRSALGLDHTSVTLNSDARTPLLIVYAFINRHYILDLLPDVSVVRNLLNQGFDIFATDWGTPGPYDRGLTINHFINTYMDKSIDFIRNITRSDKVSLLGYCWGGNLVLSYAAMHPEKVKNIITVATPGDSEADNTLLSIWAKKMKVNTLLDAFGNVPSPLLNAAFALRSPVEYLLKYPLFFERPHDLESILEFFATEAWLHDSRPVIGEIYREFIEYYYQENLFIKNRINLEGMPVNLAKITAPFLNVIALRDDLVSASSSKALNNAIGSHDVSTMEFNSGHVGLIIGSRAHKEIWPKVGEWLKVRS